MGKSLSTKFIDKAEAALSSAVEIYNKPAFSYREETFALLMINAWELLLKGRILEVNKNRVCAIRVYEKRRKKSGDFSKKQYLKRNRSKNPVTLGLGACMSLLDNDQNTRLSPAVKSNILALTEIRDNAAHYIQASPLLAKQVLEVASASIQNFIVICNRWFKRDLSKSLSLILPLSFISGTSEAALVSVSADERNLISYLENLGKSSFTNDDNFNVALRLDIKLQRSNLGNASKVEISNEPGATKVIMSEEDIRNTFPWDYAELVKRLKTRYTDFKTNPKFFAIKKSIMSNEKLVFKRLLDQRNPRSLKKDFYNPNVFQVFDKHYTLK
jgi:Domain of unknown function (DUF3644)